MIVLIRKYSKDSKKKWNFKKGLRLSSMVVVVVYLILQCKKLSIGAWLSLVNCSLVAKSLTLNFYISKTIWWIVPKFHMTMFLTMPISILSSMHLLLYRFSCNFRFIFKQSFSLCSLFLQWIFLQLGRSFKRLGWSMKIIFIIILYFRFSRSRCVAIQNKIGFNLASEPSLQSWLFLKKYLACPGNDVTADTRLFF